MATLIGCDFCKFVNYESSDDFYLFEVGTNACVPGYSYEHFVSKRCILHFVFKGKGRLVLGGNEYHIHAHQAFLIPEDSKAFYQADEEDPWEYAWLHIGGPKHLSILKEAGLDSNNPVFTPTACADEIENLVYDIINHYDREYYCIGSIYRLFDYLIKYSKDKADNTVNNSLLYVKNVISYIQLKYSEPVTIETIAFSCGLNRSYLTRLFKNATGYSLQEYLIVYRMKMACKILTETTYNIQSVAALVGYNDAFNFTKAFKKHTGKSPTEYRNNSESE